MPGNDGEDRRSGTDGFLIEARELFIRDGKIVLRYTGIILNLTSDNAMQLDGESRPGDSQITWTRNGNDENIVETNGKILPSDSGTVVWPRDAAELRLRLR